MNPLIKNEVGNKHGRLLVIEYAGIGKHGHAEWKCLCDCGKETVVSGVLLRSGGVRSCGCLGIETRRKNGRATRLPNGQAACRSLYTSYRCGANRRGLVFDLSLEEFKKLTNSNCYYCNIPPEQEYNEVGRCASNYIYNGIDRVDNTKGYTLDNCVPCCFKCNRAKAILTKEEFISLIKRIYKNLELG